MMARYLQNVLVPLSELYRASVIASHSLLDTVSTLKVTTSVVVSSRAASSMSVEDWRMRSDLGVTFGVAASSKFDDSTFDSLRREMLLTAMLSVESPVTLRTV